MLGAITNIDSLKRWFSDNGKPFFTLKYDGGSGSTDRIILRNDSIEDMEKAWERLQSTVLDQADSGRARLALFTYEKGKHNNPTAYTFLDVRPGGHGAQGSNLPAGISGLPAGIGSVADYVDMKVKMAQLEWENDQLQQQLNAPANTFERTMETISGIPGMSDVFKILAAGLVSKVNPQAMPVIQGILNGTPESGSAADDAAETHTDHADPQQRFSDNIQRTAAMLGTDPLTLSEKLMKRVIENPDLAKQYL